MTARKSAPVSIITGFLGAGKTTLLNRVLGQAEGLRVAVLVNDFGAINVDAALIGERDGETISFTNGCICCRLNDDLLLTVTRLLQRADPPQHILIETSGVSDPAALAATFNDRELQNVAPLESVITVVDAEHVLHLDEEMSRHARLQVAGADMVVLNKTDLVDADEVQAVRAWIDEVSEGARVLESVQGIVPLEFLLGIGRGIPERSTAPHVHDETCQHEAAHAHDETCQHEAVHVHDETCQHEAAHEHDET
jgi:G3E family GTPase